MVKFVLMNFTGRIFKSDIRQHSGIQGSRQMRTKADAHIKWGVEVQLDRRSKLVHWLTHPHTGTPANKFSQAQQKFREADRHISRAVGHWSGHSAGQREL